jgi:membrane protease subunit (stomatin/prohibitin family)
VAGKTAKATYPPDELRDIFYQVGAEMEKALTMAAHETHEAFKKVSQDFQQRNTNTQQTTSSQATVTCPKCGTKNPSGSAFCSNCGASLTSEGTQGST